MATTKIPTEFLLKLESTFVNLVNEGRPFESKLKEVRSYLYLIPDNSYIITTKSKEEVEKLHLSIRNEFKDWDCKSFSVPTNNYNSEWHWTFENGKLYGSSGYNALKRHIENNPDFPVVDFSQFLN